MSNQKISLEVLQVIDNINKATAQASAILNLLMSDGESIKEGFHCNHSSIIDALWAISDLVDQIKKETKEI